jgi:hypothetical protein
MTSMSTILEQDFTVHGKKGSLDCPFSSQSQSQSELQPPDEDHHQNHQEAAALQHEDPICAAMYDDTGSQPATATCPIRYLNQHSPAEIADYLEKHKHELPRNHEVCIKRYQKNEEHIRKLDAKYGTLVSMVEGLSKIHQPMLPEQDTRPQSDVEMASDDKVHNWAHTVSATVAEDPDQIAPDVHEEDEERQSHFDRPMKEVRVGESPSRPWGIQVPVFSDAPSSQGIPRERPESPPPAPVHMPYPLPTTDTPVQKNGRCPFDHNKLTSVMDHLSVSIKQESKDSVPLADITPYNPPFTPAQGAQHAHHAQHASQAEHAQHVPPPQQASTPFSQPTFVNTAELPGLKQSGAPQVVFNGPVFIGYPVEQALQFMQHFQAQQH